MIKVHIAPDYLDKPDKADGGIRRVSEAMIKHLPAYGVEHVRNPRDADIIVNHGATLTYAPGKPIVNVNHGLMWSRQDWGDGMQDVNRLVTESMARAVAHTAPSEWVANAIRRGGLWYPEVVYHGVDAGDFEVPDSYEKYVLWNKARADYVSNPQDVMTLARFMSNTKFVSTLGRGTTNLKIMGTVPYDEMRKTVAQAGVYLATARETFGIGTLEAMACGVPIAGWDWGGQSEIVVQGETGYLAPPGDYKSLIECVNKCFEHRNRLGANARHDVETRWKWEPRIEQYANLFKRVYDGWYQPRPKVSVIITTYHLDRYLPQCIESVIVQSERDWECLVIDDANSHETWKIVESYQTKDERIRYVPTPQNLGLPGARNFGFGYAKGKYIRHLDADDWLAPECLKIEADSLDSQPGWHIVYGHLESVNDDGSRITDEKGHVKRGGWPPDQFDWLGQMAHLNQLPSCVMARREVFERSGGYRQRMKRNEDAEFWCRVTSLGFRARKVTQAVTYYHRMREDSKGALEWKNEGGEPDWTAWFPWRVGASNYRDAMRILQRHGGEHPRPYLVPFGAQGQAPGRRFWMVHDHAYPKVSVIITVGPGHEEFLLDALDSVQAQSFPDWEVIVVNDTGKPWERDIMGAPYARVVSTEKNAGAAAARNLGYAYARGQYIVWMDGDDFWLPWFLERLIAHAERNPGVVYSDCYLWKEENGALEVHRFKEFNEDALAANMKYAGSSVLIPRDIVEKVFELQGGWDTQIPGKEDHDWQIAVHSLGFCAYRVDEPLFVYRMWSTTKRETDFAKIDIIGEYLNKKWRPYRLEGKVFMCGCRSNKKTTAPPASLLQSSGNFDQSALMEGDAPATAMVRVEYIGPSEGSFSIRSRVLRDKTYRFGNNPQHKEQVVFLEDAEFLLSQRIGERPTYRIMPTNGELEARDPAGALGMTIGG